MILNLPTLSGALIFNPDSVLYFQLAGDGDASCHMDMVFANGSRHSACVLLSEQDLTERLMTNGITYLDPASASTKSPNGAVCSSVYVGGEKPNLQASYEDDR